MKFFVIFLTIMVMAFVADALTRETRPSINFGSFATFFSNTETIPDELQPQSLTFVGDVLLARRVETYLDSYGSDYIYSRLPTLSTSTALIGNFEATIPKEHIQTPDMTFSFSVDSNHIPALSEYGFSYMSLANNHSGDKGTDDFIHTQQVLNENGINSFGTPTQLSTTSIAYIALKSKIVALIGLNVVAQTPTKTALEEIFLHATTQSDIQIVYVHWGTEYQPKHSAMQEKLAHTLVSVGADAVIGHHPHVVQDIEIYKGVPIFYSLGNFIFDQYFSTQVQEGLWVELAFEENVMVYRLQGITSIGSRSVPRFMTAFENKLFLDSLAKNSSENIQSQIRQGKIVQ